MFGLSEPETQNARADHASSFWLVPDPTFLYHSGRFSQCRRQPRPVSGNVPFSIIFFSTRCIISSTLSSPISPASPFSIAALRVLNFSSRSRSRRVTMNKIRLRLVPHTTCSHSSAILPIPHQACAAHQFNARLDQFKVCLMIASCRLAVSLRTPTQTTVSALPMLFLSATVQT